MSAGKRPREADAAAAAAGSEGLEVGTELKRQRRDMAEEYNRAVQHRACLLDAIEPLRKEGMPPLDAIVCSRYGKQTFLACVLKWGVEGVREMGYIRCQADGCPNYVEEDEAIQNEGRDGRLCCSAHRRCANCDSVLRAHERREDYCEGCQRVV